MLFYRDSEETVKRRKELVQQLAEKGIYDRFVLNAISKVLRHLYIRDIPDTEAYEDKPFPIGDGQTISQPYTVAYQTQLLKVLPGHKILELGTGSGYQASVLAEMGAEVYTTERIYSLYQQASRLLSALNYDRVHCYFADGTEGLPECAPFDRILVTASAGEVPPLLLKQLKAPGVMVIPLDGGIQRMMRISQQANGTIEYETFDYFQFVPVLKGTTEE